MPVKMLKEKRNLEPRTKEKLRELISVLRAPSLIVALFQDALTKKEARLVGGAGVFEPAEPKDWVIPQRIIEVVAQQRRLSLERALLELARRLDLISVGQYEGLREGIGEPVVTPQEVPVWDPESGELRYYGEVVRTVDLRRAKNIQQILNDFQEVGWRSWIANPFPKETRTLTHTLETLNEGLRFIRFVGDGVGGVVWRDLPR